MSLAVKQFKYPVGKEFTEAKKFIKGVRNLRRFASRDNDFIIKLLCTFRWRNHYYFLFPWANGNLYDFWSHHSDPLAPLQQPPTARWFSTQCLGLATALRDIHRGDAHSILHSTPQQKNQGKHGDIKPENILYFKTGSEEDAVIDPACLAHLKISDLGEAEFHSTTSMEVDAAGILHTPSYSAPELRVKKISMPNYDIFSLACVLLEFVTWYLRGFDEVKRFREKRLKEQEAPVYNFHTDFKVDSFFKHVTVHVDEGRHQSLPVAIGAMHKSCVTEVSLHQDWTHISYWVTDVGNTGNITTARGPILLGLHLGPTSIHQRLPIADRSKESSRL
jgi:serine/threonine protein kinase